MKRLAVVLAVLVVLSCWPGSVGAQGDGTLQCEADAVASVLSQVEMLLTSIDGDVGALYAASVEARALLATLDSACLGLDVEGQGSTVLDAAYVPSGIYRVGLQIEGADSSLMVTGRTIDGSCGDMFDGDTPTLFLLATDGDEVMFESEGCTVIWEVQDYFNMPWVITWEKLG